MDHGLYDLVKILEGALIAQIVAGISALIVMARRIAVNEATSNEQQKARQSEHQAIVKDINELKIAHEKEVARLEAEITVLKQMQASRDVALNEIKEFIGRVDERMKNFKESLDKIERSIQVKQT